MSGGNSYFRMWVRMTMAPVADSGDDVDMDTPVWLRLVLQAVAVVFGVGAVALVLIIAASFVRYVVGLLL